MNKSIITSIIGAIMLSSCSQIQTQEFDKTALNDHVVCTGAVAVSASIRKDETRLAVYQKSSDILAGIIVNDAVTRTELKQKLNEALSKLFTQIVVDKVVSEIVDLYDENMQSLQANEKLVLALKSTKSAIDSGIYIYLNKERPVRVVTLK